MAFIKKNDAVPVQPKRRSVLGLLFNPQLGPAVSPLRDTTRIFLHLVASVFALYKLIPKDFPGLLDLNAPLSLSEIIGTAWDNLQFTREGAPRALIFFAVTGIMLFSGVMAVLALLSLLVGQAHAQAACSGGSCFTAPSTSDMAQSWINYLFNNGSFFSATDTYGEGSAQMQDPFAGSISLQSALMGALALYSDAILIIAAIILFYHLAAMVVETAHDGVAMGKRANQIWAPIRLVVAIGLLIPINGGLSSGQYIVIKVASLGSALASNTWSLFLTQLASYNSQAAPPSGPLIEKAALDIIRMKACQASWNYHVQEIVDAGASGASSLAISDPTGESFVKGNVPGTKFSFSGSAAADEDVCGYYFVPSGATTGGAAAGLSSQLAQTASQKQLSALQDTMSAFTKAGDEIKQLIPPATAGTGTPTNTSITFTSSVVDAVAQYQLAVNNGMGSLASSQGTSQIASAIATMQPYGWAMAGSFLNTISHLQGALAAAASGSAPVTAGPKLPSAGADKPAKGFWASIFGGDDNQGWNLRQAVAKDMAAYDVLESNSITSAKGSGGSSSNDAQCAAMVGLNATSVGATSDAVDYILGKVDLLAQQSGVWTSGSGSTCGGSMSTGSKTFSLGVQINQMDPIAQMARLGHANLNVAFQILGISMGAQALGGLASAIPYVGPMIGGLTAGAGGLLSVVAVAFFTAGFTLAFLLPLMPFMRFFFAVLTWFAAIIEAVIAVPLIALAHLNPEGAGLPGKAQGAYFFVFNLFLRPVMTIFGLICGLIMFMIALSFLNYAYAIAVAGAGGTAYGHAALSRIVYSILYVAILYIAANHCFMLVDHIPDKALSWMGQGGQAMQKMGEAGNIESYGSAISGLAGNSMMMQMSQHSGHLGQHGAGAYKQIGERADKKQAKADRLQARVDEEKQVDRDERKVAALESLAGQGGGEGNPILSSGGPGGGGNGGGGAGGGGHTVV